MKNLESDAKLRFSIEAKTATDSSYKQWVDAMRMVVRLPGGIPPEFRRKVLGQEFNLSIYLSSLFPHLFNCKSNWLIFQQAIYM